jgi:hypothetical protein
MVLDAPALQLRVTMEDVMGILEGILKQRHWKKFDLANISLVYVPYWFFNYDIYQEASGQSQTYSAQMCMDAVRGELQPIMINILDSIPVEQEKELTHGIKYELMKALVSKDEAAKVAQLKVAGETGLPKDTVTISGMHLVFVPIWRIWVTLKAGIQRIELDGVSGSPFHIDRVPEKQRGIQEVTEDMLKDLSTPAGWVDYSQRAFDWGLGAISKAGSGASGSGLWPWLVTTRSGHLTLLAVVIILLLVYVVYFKKAAP